MFPDATSVSPHPRVRALPQGSLEEVQRNHAPACRMASVVCADLGRLLGTRCPVPHSHPTPRREASGHLYSCSNHTPHWPDAPRRRPRGRRDVSPEPGGDCRPHCHPRRFVLLVADRACAQAPSHVGSLVHALPHTGSWGPAEVQGSHRGKGLTEEMSPGHAGQGRRGAEVMGASTGPDGLGREEAGQAGARP